MDDYDLESQSKTYSAILNSGHPFWKPYGDVARGYISAINILRVKEIRPLLLAVVTNFPNQQAIKALRLLVSCVVRSLVVTGRSGLMETHYCATAKSICDGKITRERELRDKMREAIPGDAEFRQEFGLATSSNNQRVRYFLREIERYANVDHPEWVPSESVDDVSLEHILPRSLSDDWSEFDEETHHTYVQRLGNLAILAAGENSELGNAGFKQKKKTFKKSSFKTTASVSEMAKWTPDEINARQEELAEFAVKTWPLSGDQRPAMKKKAANKKDAAKKTPKKRRAP
jgi:hypothetical protein